jgi:hypothetical protein
VLTALEEWYVFDDLYLYQQVRGLGADADLTPRQLESLVGFLGWTVRARIRHEDSFFTPDCTWEDVDRMVEAVMEAFRDRKVRWETLLEEWLMRLARHHGCTRWGYKTPQDFMHMHLLAEHFPGVHYVFIQRDPRRMMASMKFVREQDGDPRQYHPVAYALYWRMAYKTVRAYEDMGEAPVLSVHFEDLVKDPDAAAAELGAFLGSTVKGKVPVKGKNTSFSGGKRKDITPTEAWLCERLAGDAMEKAGYTDRQGRFRLRDLPDLAYISCRFTIYQVVRVATQRDARASVKTFLKRLIRRGHHG